MSIIKYLLPVSAMFAYMGGLFYVIGEVKKCKEADHSVISDWTKIEAAIFAASIFALMSFILITKLMASLGFE